jgi:hypothetical protein
VWLAAQKGVPAYQPAGLDAAAVAGTTGAPLGAELGAAPPDWRGLLDLLEAKTGKPFDDLWRTWIVRPEETHLLDERAAARARYDEVVARSGPWQMPPLVRQAMRAWQFEEATQLLDAADRALDDRDAVTAAAAAAGLTPPRTLRATFEAEAGFAAAGAEADAELATIGVYEAAMATRPKVSDLVEEVGLWGATPDQDIERAKTAFGDGRLTDAVEASGSARQVWLDAPDLGRKRVMSILAAAIAAIIGLALLLASVRRWRRRRRRRLPQAHPLA